MGSSRASTPADRNRSGKRAAAARGGTSRRAATHPKPAKRKPAARKTPARTSLAKRKPVKRRAAPKPRVARRRSQSPKQTGSPRRLLSPVTLVAALLIVALLGAAYQFWFRNSSFVAVKEVKVEGVAGPQAGEITEALTEAARGITTLNVDHDRLDAVGSRFATVAAVDSRTDFPNEMTITVAERPPVLLLRAKDGLISVAGDGTILAGIKADDLKLPEIGVPELPTGAKVDGDMLALATVAGAAPEPLGPLITDLTLEGEEGLTVTLEGDIPIYFGDTGRLEERWVAVSAVLADPKIDMLTYVDVRVPDRPAIGGAAPPVGPEETTTTP